MCPSLSCADEVDGFPVDSCLPRYGMLWESFLQEASHFFYLNFRILRHVVFGSSSDRRSDVISPPFRHHILNVVLAGSKEEMIGTNTRRVVAVMEHPQAVRDRAVRYLPRKPVCYVVGLLKSHLPISMRVSGRSPKPTFTRLIDFAPEGLVKISAHLATGSRARLAWSLVRVKRVERLSAARADQRNTFASIVLHIANYRMVCP